MATARVAVVSPSAPGFGLMGVGAVRRSAMEVITARAETPKVGQWFLALVAVVLIIVGAFFLDAVVEDSNFVSAPVGTEGTSTPGDEQDQAAGEATPVEGLTIFAIFFVAAQGIERLLEPFSKILLPAEPKKDAEEEKAAEAQTAAQAILDDGGSEAARNLAQKKVNELAEAKAETEGNHQQRVILFWAIATLVGMVASAMFKLYFLRTVGIADASRPLEILATGLIIGAGTKPLHDLVTMIQAKAESAEEGTED